MSVSSTTSWLRCKEQAWSGQSIRISRRSPGHLAIAVRKIQQMARKSCEGIQIPLDIMSGTVVPGKCLRVYTTRTFPQRLPLQPVRLPFRPRRPMRRQPEFQRPLKSTRDLAINPLEISSDMLASPRVHPRHKSKRGQSFSRHRKWSVAWAKLELPGWTESSRNRRIRPVRLTSTAPMSLGRRRRRKSKRGQSSSHHQNRIVASASHRLPKFPGERQGRVLSPHDLLRHT